MHLTLLTNNKNVHAFDLYKYVHFTKMNELNNKNVHAFHLANQIIKMYMHLTLLTKKKNLHAFYPTN